MSRVRDGSRKRWMARWEDKRRGSRQEGEGIDLPDRGINRGMESLMTAGVFVKKKAAQKKD